MARTKKASKKAKAAATTGSRSSKQNAQSKSKRRTAPPTPIVEESEDDNDVLSLSSTRLENDRHDKEWWATNFEKSAAIVKRCMNALNWDESSTKRVLQSYRHFLILKKEMQDWDAKVLYPAWPVDEMWKQHMLVDDFDFDIANLCGHVLRRRLIEDAEEKSTREETTREAIQNRFGSEYDEELWKTIKVRVYDQLDGAEEYKINVMQPLSTFFDLFAERKEDRASDYEFLLFGEKIGEGATPNSVGMKADESGVVMIEALHIKKVKIGVHYVNGHIAHFLVEKTSMLSKNFEAFSLHDEEERASLVFTFNDTRIYGFESPATLGLNHCDVIDAVPAEKHSCATCVSCIATKNSQAIT